MGNVMDVNSNDQPHKLWKSVEELAQGNSSLATFDDSDFYNDFNIDQSYSQPDTHDVFHAYLSKLLYKKEEEITNHCYQKWGFDKNLITSFKYKPFNACEIQAFVLHHDNSKRTTIAFRGTQPTELMQWATDSKICFTQISRRFNNQRSDKVLVHTGFWEALGLDKLDFYEEIDLETANDESPLFIRLLKVLKESKREKYKISITGHSLGGALASLFSFVLCHNDCESSVEHVYTYGQPAVGNYEYAKILHSKLGSRFRRWINHNDIIASVPFTALTTLIFDSNQNENSNAQVDRSVRGYQPGKAINTNHSDYYHCGSIFKINEKEDLENVQNEGISSPSLVLFANLKDFSALLNHSPGQYTSKIKKYYLKTRS